MMKYYGMASVCQDEAINMYVRENKKKNGENMNYFRFPTEGIETRFVTIESGDYICTAVDETLGICLFDTENTMQRNPSKCKATVFRNSRSDPNFV